MAVGSCRQRRRPPQAASQGQVKPWSGIEPVAQSSGSDDGILAAVPVVSIFFGIVIRMYFREHEPKHFHAEHQSQEGKFDFDGNQFVGNITSRNALGLIRQWAQINRAALETNWSKIQAGQPLDRIPPLE
jgi:hypothetical protein